MHYQSLLRVAISWVLPLLWLILVIPGSAFGQVLDPFTGATPSFDVAPDQGTNYNTGDWGISDQNGAVTYSVPIDLPPGRNGMAPSLNLRYSSNLPLRGGLAAGWTFELPSIEQDLSLGVSEDMQYKISLGSVAGRLIEVPDDSPYPQSTAYRVQFDNSNTRIFLIGDRQNAVSTAEWVALTPDGIRHHFERARGAHHGGVWNITRQVDPFGNTVAYEWTALFKNVGVYLGQSIVSIEYSGNLEAGLVPHAKVVFGYAPLDFCVDTDLPIGAAYRKGSKQATGSQSLETVKAFVREDQTSGWSLRKQVNLIYRLHNSVLYDKVTQTELPAPGDDATPPSPNAVELRPQAPENVGVAPISAPPIDRVPTTEAPEVLGATTTDETPARTIPCGQNPIRYLTRIEVSAFNVDGDATVLPPIEFDYNSRRDLTLPTSRIPSQQPMREVTADVPGFGQEGINAPQLGGLVVTLLDIDSDGIKDRFSVIEEDSVCTLVWTRGLRSGSFEDLERKSPLPTAAWYREWSGIPGSSLDGKEGCTLSGQVAYRSTEIVPQPGTKVRVLAPGHLSYQFMDYTGDGRLDLVTNAWAASGCFDSYDPWVTSFTDDPVCGFGLKLNTVGGAAPSLAPEKDRAGRFLWRVYPGTGNLDQPFLNQAILDADAAQRPMNVHSPVSLTRPAGEDALDLSTFVHYSVPSLFDIDGDGFLDAIDTKTTTLAPCTNGLLLGAGCDWTVYFGDGTGTFPLLRDAYVWEVPQAKLASDDWKQQSCGEDFLLRRSTVIGLRDIEGDGLADLIVRLDDQLMYSYRNTGSGFDDQARALNGNSALEQVQTDCKGFILNASLRDGARGYERRLVDLDADGLVDMVWFEGGPAITATRRVRAKFNLGGSFGEAVTLLFPEKWALSKRLLAAKWESDDFMGSWHIVNDFTDINGDGLADLVEWQAAGSVGGSPTISYVSSPGLPPAPDLLRRVRNGRGMELSFSYTPSNDRGVVRWDGEEAALPTPTWVVSRSVLEGGFGTPPTTTNYKYEQPTYASAAKHSGFRERSQFAGFYQNVQATNYANGTSKQVSKQYNYDGLHADLASTKTWRDGQLHHVVRNEWLHERVFGDLINLSLPILTATCTTDGPTISETECFSRDESVHRTESQWQFDGPVRQFLNKRVREGFGMTARPDDRQTELRYANIYGTLADPEDYRIRVSETMHTVGDADVNPEMTGRTVMKYDVTTGLLEQLRTFRDPETSGVIRYTYDPETGNQLSIQKPLQNEQLGPVTIFRYDSHKLSVEETNNELGQVTKTAFDVSTGVKVKREGPNFVSAAATAIFDTERWQLDGFGRVLSHSISLDTEDNGSPSYKEQTVERFTYNDSSFFDSGSPVSIRSEQLLDFDVPHLIPTEQKFDGRGRVLTTRQLFEGEMQTLTTYSYAGSGGVESIETVDPRDNDNRITFSYRHDGLGRVTDFTRPDGTGTSIAYTGLNQTITEVTSDGSGGSRTQKYDVFGRLTELQEHEDGAEDAITQYAYDANDNLSRITDAENNVTRMEHDFLDGRLSVARGGRSWQYRYDLNGNLISKQSPVPPGAAAANYQTTFSYDGLDRKLTQRYADLRLSSPPASSSFTNALEESGFVPEIQMIRYQYDQAQNGIGRLRRVELPYGSIDYAYDVRGLITSEQRSLDLAGSPSLNVTQQVTRAYNALGQLTASRWHDGQQSRINYDERGLVATVDWFDPRELAWLHVADYDREMTGLPRVRKTDFGQVRNYTYDALSRPLTDVLTLNGQVTPLAERNYSYTEAGDLAAVVGHTNGVSANAVYGYDAHHRLLAADGPNAYRGRFSYSPTGNVRSADVSGARSIQARNVNYTYGQVDPQAVDELVDNATGESIATFLYDDVGNMTWRSIPDGDQLLHWSGRDQIHSVDTGEGLETYYYDHTGQRTLAIDRRGNARFWFAERETHFNQNGTDSLNYVHLSGGGPALARVENGTTIELQYADALQNLMFSLDRVGNVSSSFLYGPFGEVISETGSEVHSRQFNGKESDVTTGLRYYGFRYYDPLTLRWNSGDPLFSAAPEIGLEAPQRMNIYSFSMNNPLRYLDPDGLDVDGDWGPPDGSLPPDQFCRENPGACELKSALERYDAFVAEAVTNANSPSNEAEQAPSQLKVTHLRYEFQGAGPFGLDCLPLVDCHLVPGPSTIAVVEKIVLWVKPKDNSVKEAIKAAVLSPVAAVGIFGGVIGTSLCEGSGACPIIRALFSSDHPQTLTLPESFGERSPREANYRLYPQEDPILQEDR